MKLRRTIHINAYEKNIACDNNYHYFRSWYVKDRGIRNEEGPDKRYFETSLFSLLPSKGLILIENRFFSIGETKGNRRIVVFDFDIAKTFLFLHRMNYVCPPAFTLIVVKNGSPRIRDNRLN